ncbi:MAG: glycosyltransferase family 4 protein [Candidatus Anstonellales archaeon]
MKKIAHVGKNLANVPYTYVKELRAAGLNIDLYIGGISDQAEKPYNNEEWVYAYEKYTIKDKLLDLTRLATQYDCFQTYAGSSVFLQFLFKPFIVYATGSDLHELAYRNSVDGFLMRKSLEKCEKIFFSNVHLYHDIENFSLVDKAVFIPQIISVDFHKQKNPKNFFEEYEKPIIFCPSRLDFEIKGQDRLIRAFMLYKSRGGKGTLIFVDWGVDKDKAKEICKKIKDVVFVGVMEREELLNAYLSADIIADQFVLGAMGLTSLEAMALGKPVIAYINEKLHQKLYRSVPPVLDAKNEDEIYNILIKLCEIDILEIGEKSQKWLNKYHNKRNIVKKIITVYKQLGWL